LQLLETEIGVAFMNIGCYQGEKEEVFAQEGINYNQRNKELVESSLDKLDKLNNNAASDDVRSAIPLITHQIYVISPDNPKIMDELSLNKTTISLNKLNQVSDKWQHYIWTNDESFIPQSIKTIRNVKIRLIQELETELLWPEIEIILSKAASDVSMLSRASDFIRYSVLYKFGGQYRDLDYEIILPEEFLKLLNNFDFFGGKEFDYEPVHIGSALVASIAKHPIINTAVLLLKRNFKSNNADLPDYLKYPCNKINKLLYEAGPAVITMAVYKSANQEGYNDLILPANVLFNWDYARTLTPESGCYDPNLQFAQNSKTYGYDLFCGKWHKDPEIYKKIYYQQFSDKDLYVAAQDGDLKKVKEYIAKSVNVNSAVNNVTALYIASQNGHLDVVQFLIENDADLEIPQPNGWTALYAAIVNGHVEIIKSLLQGGASLSVRDKKLQTPMDVAKLIATQEIIDLLKSPEGMLINCYQKMGGDIFWQEDVDFVARYNTITQDMIYKINNVNQYIETQTNPVPNISHQVYLFDKDLMDSSSIFKTIQNIARLNDLDTEWKHYIWTNNPDMIANDVKNLNNVEIKLIEELKNSTLWTKIDFLLKQKEDLESLSNIISYVVMQQFGGVYYRSSYEIYDAYKLSNLLKAFNFIAGKETDDVVSYMGNNFFASSANHPILQFLIEEIDRNYGNLHSLPEYLRLPCTKADQLNYLTGKGLFTIAVYKHTNSQGNVDLCSLPSKILFNTDYARWTTKSAACYQNDKPARLVNKFQENDIYTIGADVLCDSSKLGELVYNQENINIYLYKAVEKGDLNLVESYIKHGADINYEYNGLTVLNIALQNNNIAMMKLLLSAASAATNNNVKDLLLIAKETQNKEAADLLTSFIKPKKITNEWLKTDLGCYEGDIEEIFTQESINYQLEDDKLQENVKLKFANIDQHISNNKSPIPHITHQIYFTAKDSDKVMDELLAEKTIATISRLNEHSDGWQHYIWTNNINNIPQEIIKLDNVKLHNIEELKHHILWKDLNNLLINNKGEKINFVQASDIARLMIVNAFGGLYRDLDNEIYRAKDLIKLLSAYNFIGGKERNNKVTFVGNAFFAATVNHPIIETAVDLVVRNLHEESQQLPEYVQYPCKAGVKVIYTAGSAALSVAYYKSANQNNNSDVVFPARVFFNVDYARYITPKSLCHKPNEVASIDHETDDKILRTIAGDPFCGLWSSGAEKINYPHTVHYDLYYAAQKGDVADLEKYILNGGDVNRVHPKLGITPLDTAVYHKRKEAVALLLKHGANVENQPGMFTSLYRAVQSGDVDMVKMLINAGAKVNAPQPNDMNILSVAVIVAHDIEMINFLLHYGSVAINDASYLSTKEYAKLSNEQEIYKAFLDYELFNAASVGDYAAAEKLLDEGANVNNDYHPSKATPVYMAARNNHSKVLKLLIDRGGDVDSRIVRGDYPLYVAASLNNIDVLKVLLSAGANKEFKVFEDPYQYTALFVAAYSGHYESCKILLENGAEFVSDDFRSPSYVAFFQADKYPEIHNLFKQYYWNWVRSLNNDFEVVVVRYKEDLSWIPIEFPTEKVIIYNKGKDDLNYLPSNCHVVSIENLGFLGGTYLYHIVNNYDHLAKRTLFVQGEPYQSEVFLPLNKYKTYSTALCNNIIAKCINTTLFEQTNILASKTVSEWKASKYSAFEMLDYNMTDFMHRFIDASYDPNTQLKMVWGAEFAVDVDKILLHSREYYNRLLQQFQKRFPMQDFFIEKLWDVVFSDIKESSNQLLLSAAQRNDMLEVKRLIELDVDVNYQDAEGVSLLSIAVLYNNKELLALLLDKGANPNAQTKDGATMLYFASGLNFQEIAQLLIKYGADVNFVYNRGETPIYASAYNCNTQISEMLLKANARTDILVNNKHTAFHAAISSGCVNDVKLFIQHGVPIYYDEHSSYDKSTPLFYAAFLNNLPRMPEHNEIYNIIIEHYWSEIEEKKKLLVPYDSVKDFKTQVVAVRFSENLEFLKKEFSDEEIIIYNKGKDDLTDLPVNAKVVNIDNVGYLGGTYLQHIIRNYNNLPDRILFLQGDVYDVEAYFPLIRHKGQLKSNCENIIAKCFNTTLSDENNLLLSMDWEHHIRYSKFNKHPLNLIEFARLFSLDVAVNQTMQVSFGAQFAVDKDKILRRSLDYYMNLSKEFSSRYPMADHYMERLWDKLFSQEHVNNPNDLLLDIILDENIELADKEAKIDKLIEYGVDLNNVASYGVAAVPFASSLGNANVVELLLKKGADVNLKTAEGATALYFASGYNNLELTKILISHPNIDVNSSFDKGKTALYAAAFNCRSNITQVLLTHKDINLDLLVNGKHSALHAAISSGCIEDVKLLMAAGAKITWDGPKDPLFYASFIRDKSNNHAVIHQLLVDEYLLRKNNQMPEILKNIGQDNDLDFEVVVVTYNKNLDWLKDEFVNEKITIYNKGNPYLGYLPVNATVINIENVGFLGGTYLYHIVQNYDNLARRTLFVQDYPYDQEIITPMIRYKVHIDSKCKNIIAKCVKTTLLHETQELAKFTIDDWSNHPKYSGFKMLEYNMTGFMHQFVNNDYLPEDDLFMVWGAQFAVDAQNILCHDKEYFVRMLDEFQVQFPMTDFYIEKLWDEVFRC
jgi:ankyrin repeat protein/mannosyltransferase OCH1-like enzyme